MTNTRREHPTASVVDGGKVVQSPAASIEAFNATTSPKARTVAPAHASTRVDQFSGRGHDNTSQRVPHAPIIANDPRGKRFDPAPSHSSMGTNRGAHGYTAEDIAGHGCAARMCDQALYSGSARLNGGTETPHWRPNDKPTTGD